MSIVSVFVIGVLTIVTYGLPFFVFWIWARKLSNPEDREPTQWRGILLWVGLSACTVAVGAFWIGMFTNPHTYPQEDIHFRRFLRFDEITGVLGIGGALAGEGNGAGWSCCLGWELRQVGSALLSYNDRRQKAVSGVSFVDRR